MRVAARKWGLAVLLMTVPVYGGPPVPAKWTAQPLALSLSPYSGPVERGVDAGTLHGKVMCGYQGWFMAHGDGYGAGFVHWGGVDRAPPRCTVDFWPDVTELDADEKFPTNYRHADGSVAYVFSSTVKKTVLRHFRWMREYGIDGVFVQRFGSCIADQTNWNYQRSCAVLSHCREGANRYGRAFAVMYDVSFDRRSVDIIKADWSRLIAEMRLTQTPAYLRHRGAPVVSLWGYGFSHRKFEAGPAEELFQFFKRPANGGCTIMLGVPNDWVLWRDDRMRLLKEYGAIISPWNVGRYHSPAGARQHFARRWPTDLDFCRQNDKDYYAVCFPGFSWTNLKKGSAPLNAIPRLGGRFLWSQFEEVKRYGMDMAYIAMFDEVDEGTAIFKCTNDPPVGRFCTYEGLPSDHYLRLTGLGGRLLRGEPVAFPEVKPDHRQQTYRPLSQLEYYREPSPFSAQTIARWNERFAGVRWMLHPEPHSAWVTDLYNSGAFDMRVATWDDILAQDPVAPVFLFAAGNESFNPGGVEVEDIVTHLRRHLRRGGALLVLSSGRYPMFYPDSGHAAARFGFRLKMTHVPAGSRITFAPEFADLAAWKVAKADGSRLMSRELYPHAKRYTSLAKVTTPTGEERGDAIACVQPGGDLGEGRIVFAAGVMLQHPERERMLDAILAQVAPRR